MHATAMKSPSTVTAALGTLALVAVLVGCATAPYALSSFRERDPEAMGRVSSWHVELHPELLPEEFATDRDRRFRDALVAELMERGGLALRERADDAAGIVALYPHTHHPVISRVEAAHFDDVEIFFLVDDRILTRLIVHNGHIMHEGSISSPYDDDDLAVFCADGIAGVITGGG